MPLAVDTNVLARALVDDGSDQCERAYRSLRGREVLVSETVLLETEWMLRSRLKVDRARINDLFSELLSLANIDFEDRNKIARAVVAHRQGHDFADALHLLSAAGCEAMLTFDRDFIRLAGALEDVPPVREP